MKLKSIKTKLRRIKPYLPRRALPIAMFGYRTYVRILCWNTDLQDRRYSRETGDYPLPPASLRYRVHGSPDATGFLKVGKRCSENVQAALRQVDKDFDSFRNVLDFGCGCGRTIIWFAGRSRSCRLYGTDIDAEAISWCRDHLDFASFSVNDPLPPLKYPSGTFDLTYGISVFTHLDEEYQFRWLEDLRRITEPKGIVLLTVHGRHSWDNLPREDVAEIEAKGFKFVTPNTFKGIFPDWYQSAYHTEDYILERYSDYFDILAYIPSGMGRMQDVVVLQRP